MSDPREVPPTYGTEHRLDGSRRIPFREESALRDHHRRKGTHPFSDGEVIARIQADAEVEAEKSVGSEGPYSPPFMGWLEGVTWLRLHRDLPADAAQIAEALTRLRMAAARRRHTTASVERATLAVREAESDLQRTKLPATGTAEAGRWQLFGVRAAAALIEIFATGEAINAGLGIPLMLGYAFAACIALIFLFCAEQTAMVIARSAASNRRMSQAIAIGLGVACLGFGAWTVISLTEGRESLVEWANPDSHKAESGAVAGNVGFGDLAAGAGQRAGKEAARDGNASAAEPARPDLGFMLPLMFLAVASSALVAYRVELASEWRELSEVRQDAVLAADEYQELHDEAGTELEEAGLEEIERTIAVAVHVEEHLGRWNAWRGQWQADYVRCCRLKGTTPREITLEPLPTAAEILMRLLDPLGRDGPVGAPGELGPMPGQQGEPGAGPEGGWPPEDFPDEPDPADEFAEEGPVVDEASNETGPSYGTPVGWWSPGQAFASGENHDNNEGLEEES